MRVASIGDYEVSRKYEKPVAIGKKDNFGQKYAHPAFACISANRISGHSNLFASHVPHQGYIRLSISSASLYRDDHADNVMASANRIVEVELSEAQWVGMISRMNTQGVPCTLLTVNYGGNYYPIPGIEHVETAEEILSMKAQAMSERLDGVSVDAVREIESLLDGLPKKRAEAIRKLLYHLQNRASSNAQFYAKMLAENKEKLVAEAKIEISSHIKTVMIDLGVEALSEKFGLQLEQQP